MIEALRAWLPAGAPRAALLIAALMLAVYGRSLANGFVYDDLLHVVAEPVPQSLEQLARIFAEPMSPIVPYYRPLARLLNVGQKWLHGAAPLPFHALNLALGFACAWALRGLLTTRALGASAGAATLAALGFALHPIASECIYAVASGRETLLPTLFTLLACSAHLRGTPRARAAAVACFALGMLSKEQAIAIPLLLVLADALGIAPDAPRSARGFAARYAPHALVVVAYAALRTLAIPSGAGPELALLRMPSGPLLSMLYDVQTTFAPFASVIYEPSLTVWWSLPRLALAAAAAGALALFAVRADARRACWFLAWIALSLAPTANVFVQEPGFAERWGFAALAGWLGLCALAFTRLRAAGPLLRRGSWIAPLAALALCAGLTFLRGPAYRDNEAFLAQWLHSDPSAAQPWISLGEAHERRGNYGEAVRAYRRVLARNPDTALAHASLAIALANQGQLPRAEAHARRALALDPGDAESWSNLGGIRAKRGDLSGAIEHYERALTLRPRLASAHNNLGLALRARGDASAARERFELAIAIAPDFPEAHANLGDLLLARGDLAAARQHLETALALEPSLVAAEQALARLAARASAQGAEPARD